MTTTPTAGTGWIMPLPGAKAEADTRRYEAEQRALHIRKDMRPVLYETPTKQTERAVLFPTWGWVPKTSLRWETKAGWTAAWTDGKHARGDKLMMEYTYIHRARAAGGGK